jgi:hypothetical protein
VTGSTTGTSCNLQVTLVSKSARRELRKQKRIAAEKVCDICGWPMLSGKDVTTLLNCNTGNLACSSRNSSGVSKFQNSIDFCVSVFIEDTLFLTVFFEDKHETYLPFVQRKIR